MFSETEFRKLKNGVRGSCKINYIRINKRCSGRAVAQAGSHPAFPAEARVRDRVSLCEICGGRSRIGTGFSSIFAVSIFLPMLHTYVSFGE